MKPAILSGIVDNDLCNGCGVCAVICPDDVLSMQFNRFGEYNPVEMGACTKECGLCLKVCPFSDRAPDEDEIGRLLFGEIAGIQNRPETGYFLDAFVGHSQIDGHREHGSSGGMATWFLQTLLENGVVDAVVCVTPNPDPEQLFKFAVLRTADEVRAASGSAYYPVELFEVLQYIIDHPGRYAVIGLPCFVKAVRLAQLRNRYLRDRIVVVLGLVCGQLKSKQFTAYLAALAGLKEPPVSVHYRGKDPEKLSSNYYFSCVGPDGESRRIFWKDGPSEAWINRWFTPVACNYCDDIFAECADVTFMDAWLPEFERDPRGTSLIIIRSRQAFDLFLKGIRDNCVDINPVAIDLVIQSQAGVVSVKREQLAYRLFRSNQIGVRTPKKRVPMQSTRDPLLRREIILKDKMQQKCKKYLSASSGIGPSDPGMPPEVLKADLYKIRLLQTVTALIGLPQWGFRKFLGVFNGR